MAVLTKVFLILGVASITYGLARWQIVEEVMARQDRYFSIYTQAQAQEFCAAHAKDSLPPVMYDYPPELARLSKRLQFVGGGPPYAGWPQAIFPCAFGLMLLAVSHFFAQKNQSQSKDANRVGQLP